MKEYHSCFWEQFRSPMEERKIHESWQPLYSYFYPNRLEIRSKVWMPLCHYESTGESLNWHSSYNWGRYYYTAVECMCAISWRIHSSGVWKSQHKQLGNHWVLLELSVARAMFREVEPAGLGLATEYQTLLFFPCRPSAKAGTWKPQAHLLYLLNNY